MPNDIDKAYIGDGVYVEPNRMVGGLTLTTENGDGIPTNRIVLEREVFHALIEYAAEVDAHE